MKAIEWGERFFGVKNRILWIDGEKENRTIELYQWRIIYKS